MLCLITARGGSKRVPRKNIKNFCGKPLIRWTIETAKKVKGFDRILVSTDSEEIAVLSKESGAEVPFIRPAELATDTASSFSVVAHALEWLKNNEDYASKWVVLLEPSSPGRQPFHIEEVVQLIGRPDFEYDSVAGISQTPGHFHYQKQLNLSPGGEIRRVQDGEVLKNLVHRNQELSKTYAINSGLYAFKSANLSVKDGNLWGDRTYGYVMDEKYAIDIDTQAEWEIAEFKMKFLIK